MLSAMQTRFASCKFLRHIAAFRSEMLYALRGFSTSMKNGLFINSCFAHCQTERQDTWYGSNSPAIANKGIAKSVGNWYYDRLNVKEIDCAYPCDRTCHNLVWREGR